jgi:hypothetical protein
MNESRVLRFFSRCDTTLGTKATPNDIRASFSSNRVTAFTVGRSGTSVSGYRQKIANLEDATSTFSGTLVKVKKRPLSYTVSWNAPVGSRNYEKIYGETDLSGSLINLLTLSTTVADNAAKRKVLQDVMARRSSFQGAVWLAELDSTIRGIRHPLKAMRDGLTAYHARSKKIVHKVSRAGLQSALAGSWLEFQFGILQNVRDVESGLTNLKRISHPRAVKFKANGVETLTGINDSAFTYDFTAPSCILTQSRRWTTNVIVIYRGAYKVEPPSGWDFKSWGLSTQDFIPAVWEAIPYSFVVDYFTNIGQILQGYSYLQADIAWVAKTVRKSATYLQQGVSLKTNVFSYPVLSASIGSLGSTELTSTSVSRSSSSVGNLNQTFYVRVPGVGSMAWLNLAALARLKTL